MVFDMRKKKRAGAKATAPVENPNPWATVIIRTSHYPMLRELALYYDNTMGQVVMQLVSDRFNEILKTVDPRFRVEHRPSIFPSYSRIHKKTKRPGRKPKIGTTPEIERVQNEQISNTDPD